MTLYLLEVVQYSNHSPLSILLRQNYVISSHEIYMFLPGSLSSLWLLIILESRYYFAWTISKTKQKASLLTSFLI